MYWFRPKKRFDVGIQELVSKVQNSGGFSRNNVFRVDYHFSIKSFAPFWPFLAILSRIHALFGAPFTGLTSEVVPQNWKIWGLNTSFPECSTTCYPKAKSICGPFCSCQNEFWNGKIVHFETSENGFGIIWERCEMEAGTGQTGHISDLKTVCNL